MSGWLRARRRPRPAKGALGRKSCRTSGQPQHDSHSWKCPLLSRRRVAKRFWQLRQGGLTAALGSGML